MCLCSKAGADPMRTRNRRERQALGRARAGAMAPGLVVGDNPSSAREARDRHAFLARFPRPSTASSVITLVSIVLGNAYLYHQLIQGALPVTGLFLLVLVETVLLGLMAWLQLARIPPGDRPEPAHRFDHAGQAIGMWTVAIVAFGGAYVMWISMVGEIPILLGYLHGLQPWVDSGIPVALAITVGMGVAAALSDERHYRRSRGAYVSSLAIESSGRRVLMGLGVMQVALPLVALCYGLVAAARWVARQPWVQALGELRFAWLGGAALLVLFGTFTLLAQAVDSGRLGLAGVYLLNKVIAESLFALLPMLAHHQHAATAPVGDPI